MLLAKRRKSSVDQEVDESTENGSRSPVQDGSSISPMTSAIVQSESTENGDGGEDDEDVQGTENVAAALSPSEKESSRKRGRSKSLGDAMEIKMKEDAMKPVRISERLSIKRNRIEDDDEGESPAPTPKKQRVTSNAPKQLKKALSSTTAPLEVAAGGVAKAAESTLTTPQKVVLKDKEEKNSQKVVLKDKEEKNSQKVVKKDKEEKNSQKVVKKDKEGKILQKVVKKDKEGKILQKVVKKDKEGKILQKVVKKDKEGKILQKVIKKDKEEKNSIKVVEKDKEEKNSQKVVKKNKEEKNSQKAVKMNKEEKQSQKVVKKDKEEKNSLKVIRKEEDGKNLQKGVKKDKDEKLSQRGAKKEEKNTEKDDKEEDKSPKEVPEEEGKGKKHTTYWTLKELELFFTLVGAYGKQFDVISKRMSHLSKSRGEEPKSKLRIRYLYNRTVAKVSKILQQDVKTVGQEVLCLINFGALWKFMKESDRQFPKCLKELVTTGKTSFSRWLGRARRIGKTQTPVSTYLKKLEKIEEQRLAAAEVCVLPTQVTVELTPKNNVAWARVQEMSQNPRVRFKMATNRTLETVFKHLNSKWKSHRLRLKEAMSDIAEASEDELTFHLPPSVEMKPFTLKPVNLQKTSGLLNNYVMQVFPDLILNVSNDDEAEVPPDADKEPGDGENTTEREDTVEKGREEDQSTDILSDVKNGPLGGEDDVEQNTVSVKEEPNVPTGTNSNFEVSSGFTIAVSNPKDDNSQNGSSPSDGSFTMIKSEPCGGDDDDDDEEEDEDSSEESTCGQFLDFTPHGHLTVVSKRSKPRAKSKSSVTSVPVSPSSSSSVPALENEPQLLLPPSTKEGSISSTTSTTSTSPSPSTQSSSSSSLSSSTLSTVPSSSLSSSSSKAISSPLRSLTSALNLKPISNSSPPPSSSLSPSSSSITMNSTPSHNLTSPPSSIKKGAKKKINFCDNNANTNDSSTTDSLNLNADTNSNSQNDTATIDSPSSKMSNKNNALMKQIDKEFERLQALAESGFLLSNSNTVTLLHLCLLLGRASVIRLEYEWVSKQGTQTQPHHLPLPAFCSSSNRVANSLRRLCHIAALELASFRFTKSQSTNSSKEKNKADTAEGVNDQGKKKVSVRNYGTMTDSRITMPRHAILPPGKMIRHHPHGHSQHHPTHAQHPNQNHNMDSSIQMNGVGSEVFRVPLAPAYRPPFSKEEEEKLKLQEQQAKAIMQDCSMQRSRLLKRRNVKTRSKPIIVQRTLLPKVPNERIITYIQPSSNPNQVMASNSFMDVSPMPSVTQSLTPMASLAHTTVTTSNNAVTPTAMEGNYYYNNNSNNNIAEGGPAEQHLGNLLSVADVDESSMSMSMMGGQVTVPLGANILEMAVKSANIHASPVKDEATSTMSSMNDEDANGLVALQPVSHASLDFTSRENNTSLSMADQSMISISDLDLSLASASTSNMGPDAGDKFLDSVLERSQQGFAGLITPVSKSHRSSSPHQPPVIGLDSSLSAFDLSGMKTPPRSSSPTSSSPMIHRSPPSSKASPNPDQSWMGGESADVSLSSILGAFSSFQGKSQEPKLKTPSKTSSMSGVSLFDQSSSDGVDNVVTVTIPKPSFVSDVSLNSLLGDPALSSPVIKTDNHHAHMQADSTGGHAPFVAPPPSLFSEVSQDSLAKLDVDVTLQGMVNDSSMDLVSKFEKLAAHMAENRQEQEVVSATKPNSKP